MGGSENCGFALEFTPPVVSGEFIGHVKPRGASLFCIIKKVYLGVLKKGGGSGYPQALLEGLTSEAK